MDHLPRSSGAMHPAAKLLVFLILCPLACVAGTKIRHTEVPLRFEASQGQLPASKRFLARGLNYSFHLVPDGVVMRFPGATASEISMRLAGADPDALVEGVEQLPGTSNYFVGADAAKWATGIANYRKVRCRNVYPGIDIVFYGNQRQLEYDIVLAPGADPRRIAIDFRGARSLRLSPEGDLLIGLASGELRMRKPHTYQGARTVATSYTIAGGTRVSFQLGEYDTRQALVVDPVLSYATLLGSTQYDRLEGMAVDGAGNIYVAGSAYTSNFPTTAGTVQSTRDMSKNGYLAYIAKYNAAGDAFVYCTYFGGATTTYGYSIAVDKSGYAYLTGATSSSSFPTTTGAYQSVVKGSEDAYVAKISPDGKTLVYATTIGGAGQDVARSIAIDSSGNAYITGYTASVNYPMKSPMQGSRTTTATYEAFVTKLNATGTDLVYSTYLGSAADDWGRGIAVDANGAAYVTGHTSSPYFPTRNAVYATTFSKLAYKSTNSATNWKASSTGLVSTQINCIVIDPKDPKTLYAGTEQHGVFKSTDSGATWQYAGNTMTRLNIYTLLIDPDDSNTLYAGGRSAYYKSTNAAASWRTINFGQIPSIGGFVLLKDPSDAGAKPALYAAADSGIYRLQAVYEDQAWSLTTSSTTVGSLKGMLVNPSNTKVWYCHGTQGVYKSADQGATWVKASSGLPTSLGTATVYTLLLDPTRTNTLYAGTGEGVFKSLDGGQNWTAARTGLSTDSYTNLQIRQLAFDPKNTNTIYAATIGGLFKTTNGASGWTSMSQGLHETEMNAVVVDPAVSSTVYAGGTAGTDIFVTKLNPAGNLAEFSTFFGGTGNDEGRAVAVDASGNAYVTGRTKSSDFVTTPGALCTKPDARWNAFATKLTAAGAVAYSTILGGTSEEWADGIAVDAAGCAYVTGYTSSRDFPAVEPLTTGPGVPADAFISKLNPAGSGLVFSTRLGGNTVDSGKIIAVDAAGDIYVAGETYSTEFPVTANAPQKVFGGGTLDGWLAKLTGIPKLGAPFVAAVKHGASWLDGAVAPGQIVVLGGTSIGPPAIVTLALDSNGMVARQLGNTKVYFDDTPAAIIYACATQTSVVVPYSVWGKSAVSITVEYNGVRSPAFPAAVTTAAPGLFAANAAGSGPGAILNQDNTINSETNAAAIDTIVVLYGTGEGQTDPAGVDGQPATSSFPKPLLPVSVTIGGLDAKVEYAGAAPYMVAGVIQINVRIPPGVTPGPAVPVVVKVGGASSQPGLTVAVK